MIIPDKTKDFLKEKCDLISITFWNHIICRLEEWGELDRSIESPIEQLIYIEWLYRKFLDEELGLELEPQFKDKSTGKYRLDFYVDFIQEVYLWGSKYDDVILGTELPKLGVEIDSHIWHEKTKEQVQYHKQRERFLIKNGWKLLRFTGSEVFKNPPKCVNEILEVANKTREKYHKELLSKFKEREKSGKGKTSKRSSNIK